MTSFPGCQNITSFPKDNCYKCEYSLQLMHLNSCQNCLQICQCRHFESCSNLGAPLFMSFVINSKSYSAFSHLLLSFWWTIWGHSKRLFFTQIITLLRSPVQRSMGIERCGFGTRPGYQVILSKWRLSVPHFDTFQEIFAMQCLQCQWSKFSLSYPPIIMKLQIYCLGRKFRL